MDAVNRTKLPPLRLKREGRRSEPEVALDTITYEVVRHRLWSVNEEGSSTIIHASGSPVVHGSDYNFVICAPDGDIAMCGTFYNVPVFCTTIMIQKVIEKFGGDIHEGDVFVTNDPFICAVHQSDCQFVSPFFHEGALVGWTGVMAHILDLGGKVAGSWVPDAQSCYEEAIRIPLLKIVDGSRVNQGVWDLVLNNSRLPLLVGNDFNAFLASHRIAQARLGELCVRYGASTVVTTMRHIIRDTENATRAALRKIPDGEFSHVSYYDHDGRANNMYRVSCVLTKIGDELLFDFSDSAPQVVGLGNSTRFATFGTVGTIMMAIFGQEFGGWNAGLMGPVSVVFGERTILSAELPAPVSGGSAAANFIAEGCAHLCISKMLAFTEEFADDASGPHDGSWVLAQFGGHRRSGEPFVMMYMDSLGFGAAAYRFRDGVGSGGALGAGSGGFLDVELSEKTSPLLYLWRREVPDSGGAGAFRGGNGIEYALTLHGADEASATFATNGVSITSKIGMQGGYPGTLCGYEMQRGADWFERARRGDAPASLASMGGTPEALPAKSSTVVRKGDLVNISLLNGGGYGDPTRRDVARVALDVREGQVSRITAESVYGVSVDPAGSVDLALTEELRGGIRRRRIAGLRRARDQIDGGHRVADSEVAYRWDGSLWLTKSSRVACAHCAREIGAFCDNWRQSVPCRTPDPMEFGPRHALDDRFVYVQFVCPHCGASLFVDISARDQEPTVDFRLDRYPGDAARAHPGLIRETRENGPHARNGRSVVADREISLPGAAE